MRPRTSDGPRTRENRLPSVDMSNPVELPPASEGWLPATVAAYNAFRTSEAAKPIRPSEAHLATRYYDFLDQEARLWAQFVTKPDAKTLDLVHRLHRMILSLGREVGISPLARRNLGVPSTAKRVNRLAAFQKSNGQADPKAYMGAVEVA